MGTLAPIFRKLDPLIRRLSTDKGAEALACVRAIGRQLDRAGMSFHDLADTLTAESKPVAQDCASPIFTNYAAAVEWLLTSGNSDLSEREITFLLSMREILQRWPPKPKQAAWLSSLVEKLGGQFDG